MEEKKAVTLREVVALNPVCAQRLDEALRLANGLFQGHCFVPLPYFTIHNGGHSAAVENLLDQIIWGGGQLGDRDFVPTPEEAMYLLSAAWLHDIGMLYGIFPGERPEDLAGDVSRISAVRNEHEIRTLKFIQREWQLASWPSNSQKRWLSNICLFHRRHHPIGTFEPVEIAGECEPRPVRLVVLAALLRLADACHEDQSRAPGQLMALYTSLGMPGEAAVHWERAKLIDRVSIDHLNRQVSLTGYCPQQREDNLCEFDLGEVVDMVRQDIEDELHSVQQVLLRYPNTYFGDVAAKIIHPNLPLDEDKQYLALWPYLLDRPSGSTEAAAALARMLTFAVNERPRTPGPMNKWLQNALSPIMDKTQESRPVDFVIRDLCENVRHRLKEPTTNADTADNVTRYLEDFLTGIEASCRSIAEFAPTLIDPDDALVVHGYCRNITKFLEALRLQYDNSLYIVDYQEPTGKVRLGPSQNARMRDFAHEAGFGKVRFLSLAALPQVLSELKRRKVPCKVLLGTHGVLNRTDFLCKLGSYVLASVAQQCGAQVITFAEGPKFPTGGASEAHEIRPEGLFSSERMGRPHPTLPDITCLVPEVDVVPKEYIDLVVTETGWFQRANAFIPVGQSAGSLAAGKKGSSPA